MTSELVICILSSELPLDGPAQGVSSGLPGFDASGVAADGSFRVDDLPPGKYQGHLQVRELVEGQSNNERYIGSASKEFTVPAAVPPASEEPVDIGTFEARVNR